MGRSVCALDLNILLPMFWALAKELPEMHVPTSNMQYCQCALFVNQLFHAKIQFVLVQQISISGPQTDSHSHLQPINLTPCMSLDCWGNHRIQRERTQTWARTCTQKEFKSRTVLSWGDSANHSTTLLPFAKLKKMNRWMKLVSSDWYAGSFSVHFKHTSVFSRGLSANN